MDLYAIDGTKTVPQHKMFWFLVLFPVIGCLIVTLQLSTEYSVDFSASGFAQLLTISKLPLGLLSLSLVLGVIFFRFHQSKLNVVSLEHTQRIQQDNIYLEIVKESYNEVSNLLDKKNNDNITWIRAARLLVDTETLRKTIQTQSLKQAAATLANQLRANLYDQLTLPNGQPLPGQFFYGIESWETEQSIESAAISASSKGVVSDVYLDSVIPRSMDKAISTSAIVAIYDFLAYPDDYKDPLVRNTSWGDDWGDLRGYSQGAKRYVWHRSNTIIHSGKLIKKRNALSKDD